jgi:hypothetical protein
MLPKDATRYIINSVILLTTDLEAENAKLRKELENCKCVSCNTSFVFTPAKSACMLCDRVTCKNCPYNVTNRGIHTCTNHPNACGICLDEQETTHKCTICDLPICNDCFDKELYDTFQCDCGEEITSCCQENYDHLDMVRYKEDEVTGCRTCGADLCPHNKPTDASAILPDAIDYGCQKCNVC